MDDTCDTWFRLMGDVFPVTFCNELAQIEFMEDGSRIEEGQLWAVIRLVRWVRDDDGSRSLYEIKEQDVVLGRSDHLRDLERYRQFLQALATVYRDVDYDVVETAMPRDFFAADVLDLQAKSFDEFGRALTADSRLGALVK